MGNQLGSSIDSLTEKLPSRISLTYILIAVVCCLSPGFEFIVNRCLTSVELRERSLDFLEEDKFVCRLSDMYRDEVKEVRKLSRD